MLDLLSRVHRNTGGTVSCAVCARWRRNCARLRIVGPTTLPNFGETFWLCSGCLREAARVAAGGKRPER